jgi:hypothetical protein
MGGDARTTNHDRHVRPNDRSSDVDHGDVVEYDRGLASRALPGKQYRQANTQQ